LRTATHPSVAMHTLARTTLSMVRLVCQAALLVPDLR
jgi:hypothetical protein